MNGKKLLAFGIVVLAGAVLGAEGLARARAHARYGPYLDIYELHHRTPTGLLVPLADLDLEFGGRCRIRTDEHGFRSAPVPVPKPPGTLRLAFLGSSTTFCAQASTNEKTWPSLVTAALQERFPDLVVDHVNAGVTSYCLADSIAGLEQRVAAVAPDVVVYYEAANELAVDTHVLAEAAGLAEPEHVPGWLERHSLLWMLVQKNRRFVDSQREGRGDGPKLQCDLERLAAGFEDRLVGLVERARGLGAATVLCTVATRFDREQPLEAQLANMEQSFTFMPYLEPEALLAGFEAYNGAIARAARRSGAVLVDGHEALQGREAWFTDSVHFSEAGCAAQAQRVTEALLRSQPFLELVETVRSQERPTR